MELGAACEPQFFSSTAAPLRFFAVICMMSLPSVAQVRGVYPLGMSATNSGVTPESGISYVNQFLFYSRDQAKGPNGEVLATGQNSVMMDMNSVVWVSKRESRFLGGADVFHVSHNPDRQQLAHVGH